MMIPNSDVFDQCTLTTMLDVDPVVQDYRDFFSLFDWSVVDDWQTRRSRRGAKGHPITTYLKAFLIRIREGFIYVTQLRKFLLKHPLLVIELGFRLVLDSSAAFGFDAEQTLPCTFWFREKLRTLDPALLQALLAATVRDLKAEIPGLGEVVAFDVKHIYAWVKENNPRVSVSERFDKTKIPKGDPDCRLGVKRASNQEQEDGTIKEKKELLWGYGSGVAAATTAKYGDVVLAEYTLPFNEGDARYFRPLYQQAAIALSQFPTHLTADAAFDAWYVYDAAARHGGIAAVPKVRHSQTVLDTDAVPRCSLGLRMVATDRFAHGRGFPAQRYRCPLLHPQPTEGHCEHEQFAKGVGCVKLINVSPGGLQRLSLDRSGPLYKSIYPQRTCCERINSQAKELGIERPRVRTRRSVANLNTLIYLVINVRALQRVRTINADLLFTLPMEFDK